MNFKKIILFAIMLGFVASFQSCQEECTRERTFTNFIPIWMTADQIRSQISVDGPTTLQNPGKIYYYDQYLFIADRGRGIHIFDNQNPVSPTPISFINIPGNEDMAVKEGIMYANNYIDLININIQDPTNPVVIGRTEDVFPPISTDQNGRMLVGYDEEEVTQIVECNNWGNGFFLENVFVSMDANAVGGSVGPTGFGGSMARFTIAGDYLYTVDDNDLHAFSISNLTEPVPVSTTSVGWGIETIYPAKEHLFIGSSAGMFIYGLENPAQPNFKGDFQHARACDPVVVKGDYAYVTLRSGTFCQGFSNQLDLVNVSNVLNPYLVKSYPMHNPHGLAISENSLFLCEGDQGLKVFDIEDPLTIDQNQIEHIKGFYGYDAIALPGKLLLVVGEDGLYQFDYSDPSNLEQLSVIIPEKP